MDEIQTSGYGASESRELLPPSEGVFLYISFYLAVGAGHARDQMRLVSLIFQECFDKPSRYHPDT